MRSHWNKLFLTIYVQCTTDVLEHRYFYNYSAKEELMKLCYKRNLEPVGAASDWLRQLTITVKCKKLRKGSAYIIIFFYKNDSIKLAFTNKGSPVSCGFLSVFPDSCSVIAWELCWHDPNRAKVDTCFAYLTEQTAKIWDEPFPS